MVTSRKNVPPDFKDWTAESCQASGKKGRTIPGQIMYLLRLVI